MSRVRIGVAGCGKIALSAHLPILSRMPDVEIAALADPDRTKLQAAARFASGAAQFPDSEKLLAKSTLDALVICLPNHLHAKVAILAMDRGKHIYLEKPLGITLEEGRAVLQAWKLAGVTAMIGFNYRFNKLYESVRRIVESGQLGEPLAMRSVFSLPVHQVPEWKRSVKDGGGALFDLGSHHIDLVHRFFGSGVCSVTAGSDLGRGESATLDLHLSNGVRVQSFFCLGAVEEDRIEIYGRSGKVSADRHLSLGAHVSGPTHRTARLRQAQWMLSSARRLPYLLEKRRAPAFEPSYRTALHAFVSAVKEPRPVTPDLSDGYRSLAVVQAALESAATGRRVTPLLGHENSAA